MLEIEMLMLIGSYIIALVATVFAWIFVKNNSALWALVIVAWLLTYAAACIVVGNVHQRELGRMPSQGFAGDLIYDQTNGCMVLEIRVAP